MKQEQEWDWPPTRRHYRPTRRHYYRRTFNVYPDAFQPRGWANSPRVEKAISIYCKVLLTAIKVVIAIPLSLMLIGSIWLIWNVIKL